MCNQMSKNASSSIKQERPNYSQAITSIVQTLPVSFARPCSLGKRKEGTRQMLPCYQANQMCFYFYRAVPPSSSRLG